MHVVPNNSTRSSVNETQPLIARENKRSLALPLIASAIGGFMVMSTLKTTVLDPQICDVSHKMHLNTPLEQFAAAFAAGAITCISGTLVGYFCQKPSTPELLAMPINSAEAQQEADVAF